MAKKHQLSFDEHSDRIDVYLADVRLCVLVPSMNVIRWNPEVPETSGPHVKQCYDRLCAAVRKPKRERTSQLVFPDSD